MLSKRLSVANPRMASMLVAGLTRSLRAPVVKGKAALFWGIVAVALPTAMRAAVSGVVTGCEFTPYLPFVLLAAIALGWWQAAAVALVSVAILGGLFFGPQDSLLGTPCFISGAGLFLGSSAMMIGIVVLARRLVAAIQRRGADDSSGGIVFSLEQGEVWASWYGQGAPVRLGSQRRVAEMMEDFLKQVEVGKRLTDRSR